jgi:hypothetical protein
MASNKYIIGLGHCTISSGVVLDKKYKIELPLIRLGILEKPREIGEKVKNEDVNASSFTDIIFTNIEACYQLKSLIDDCIAKFENEK